MSAQRPWENLEEGRLVGRGHPAGDFLEAYDWERVATAPGSLRVIANLPAHARNPRGQLFGGFTPTYVDFLSLYTVRVQKPREAAVWLATTHMSVDYYEPILGPRFAIEGTVEKSRGRTHFVTTRFFIGESFDQLAVFASTTMREVRLEAPLGDV